MTEILRPNYDGCRGQLELSNVHRVRLLTLMTPYLMLRVDGRNIWAYTVLLAPSKTTAEVEHVLLIQLDSSNDCNEHVLTHNYTWYAMRRFDHNAQLWKAIYH